MKKSQLYTRTGDLGSTSLIGGTRTSKASQRLQAYGTIDELNSWLGVLATDPLMPTQQKDLLQYLQHRLFDIGAYLATPPQPNNIPLTTTLGQQTISRLEHQIDTLDDTTPPARQFIIPGGTQLSAFTHVARTVCRRAERHIIKLIDSGEYVDPDITRLINRLSDYLFILSRYINHITQTPEAYWQQIKK